MRKIEYLGSLWPAFAASGVMCLALFLLLRQMSAVELSAQVRLAILVVAGGLVYAESDRPFDPADGAWLAGWQIVREDKAGQVYFALLTPDEQGENGSNDTGPN